MSAQPPPPTTGIIPAGILDDDRNDWTVHNAANGVSYYFNKKVSFKCIGIINHLKLYPID